MCYISELLCELINNYGYRNMNIEIQSLRQFASSGVFSLLDRAKKRVYLGFGVNMLNSITRLIEASRTDKDLQEFMGSPGLEIGLVESLETNGSPGLLRTKLAHWTAEYERLGYTHVRSYRGMRYKTKTVLDISGRVVVMLTRPGCKPIVVGVFVRPRDAQLFLELNYDGKEILQPIYCKNKYTKEWLLKYE